VRSRRCGAGYDGPSMTAAGGRADDGRTHAVQAART
jgi:hypothetical protein